MAEAAPTLQPTLFKRLLKAMSPVPPAVTPFKEMGVSGTAVFGGYVQQREKSSKWTGRQRYITISDMAVNASIVTAGVHLFANLVARPGWTIAPADDSAAAKEAAEFVDEVLNSMDQSWTRVVRRACMFRFYGFGIQEWTAKKRDDGRIGLESIEPRPQASIERWSVADDGKVEGVWQRNPSTGQELGLPRSKILYLVDDTLSDSPEGVGMFRHLADPWERLQTYYTLEAIGFERDLRGTPIGRIPYAQIREAVKDGDLKEDEATGLIEAVENFVKLQVKEPNTAITMDSLPYFSQAADGAKVASVPQWGLELLQGGAQGAEEIARAITRTQTEMARVLSSEHLMLGESSGNRALSEDKSENFYLVANSVLGDIASGVEHDIVATIGRLNAIPEELWPECKPEDVAPKDAEAVANTLAKMAQAGAVLDPNDPVVDDVRSLLGVSEATPVSPEMANLPIEPVDDDEGVEEVEDDDDDEGAEEVEDVNKAKQTLFVKRTLLNAGALREWARSQGFQSTLPAGDMHVTIAFSRDEVEMSEIQADRDSIVVLAGERFVHQFPPRTTPNGAVVLRLESAELRRRWQYYRDRGASWDFAEYNPHVTITYAVEALNAMGEIVPYRGPLIFGPEEMSEVNLDFATDLVEAPLAKKQKKRRTA